MDVAFVPNQSTGQYQGDAIVALHGSWATADKEWGRGDPATRRAPALMRIAINNDGLGSTYKIVDGFQLEDGQRWTRPAGVAIGPDGNIYFTSDGGIHGLFRLRWQ